MRFPRALIFSQGHLRSNAGWPSVEEDVLKYTPYTLAALQKSNTKQFLEKSDLVNRRLPVSWFNKLFPGRQGQVDSEVKLGHYFHQVH